MTRRTTIGLLLAFLVTALTVAGWLAFQPDHAATFDRQVEAEWFAGRKTVAADEFFAGGGVYANRDDGAHPDRDVVLPLLQKLNTEHQLKFVAVLDRPQQAYALLAELPADRQQRNAIRAAIVAADEAYPGLILQNWGRKWLSLDLLGPDDVAMLRETGTLARIEAEQREPE